MAFMRNISAGYVLFCRTKENQKGRRCPEGMKAPVGLLSRRPVCEANAACSARQGRSDFDALDPTGCGAQRPLRALSGTRVLLTAAPTAPPCIRRWRRASPLHFFLASPIDRPLSRCGGSSPQGSGGALSVTFGDTSPKGRGKKRALHSLGSPFGRAGAKRLRGFVPPQGSGCSR